MTSEPISEQIPTTPFGSSAPDSSFDETNRHLAATKPWVRLVSVLGILFSVLALSQLVLGPIVLPVQMVIVPVTSIIFYFIPSILLWKYGSRIGEYVHGQNALTFSEALSAQRSFWKYVGILVLALLVLYAAIVLFGVMVLVVMSFR